MGLLLTASPHQGACSYEILHHPSRNRQAGSPLPSKASLKLGLVRFTWWDAVPFSDPPPSLRLFKNGDIRIKIEREKNNNNEGSSNNTHRQVLSMLATSARSGWEALGIPKRRPRQKQLKASRRKVRLLDREQRHHQYHFWQNKTTKKTQNQKIVLKKS